MLSARDYIDFMTTNRLNRRRVDDIEVSNDEFDRLCAKMRGAMIKMSRETAIPGFDTDDLEGFYQMKLHQILRRNQPTDFSYCARSLQSVTRNIIKEREVALKQLHKDMLEDCEFMYFYNM